MKADLTRDSFRPEQHFTRVVFPQGHALTEAELNEQAQIQVHRDRVTALDVIGQTGTPNGDGFQLVVSPDGKDLLIRPGRYYVDGRLVEGDGASVAVSFPAANAIGLPALTLDGRAVIAGEWLEVAAPGKPTHRFQITAVDVASRRVTVGANDVGPAPDSSPLGSAGATVRRIASYVIQPDWPRPTGTSWPAAPGLPALTAAPALYGAYLEVFSHHVSGISDPQQREVALGGVDGASRERTAWQVRLRAIGAVGTPGTCAQVLPAPVAGGSLRARARRPATGSHPCIIEPAAQYRRLENQLYRVEIHQGGGFGDPGLTFKWSRENASVVMPWLSSTATELTLATAGRDSKLGLASGDWLELTDDQRELGRSPGTLVQIDTVEGVTVKLKPGTATGTTAIADFLFHPRVRRWDHAGAAALAVTRPASNDGYLALEDGVEVRFGDGAYASGDHWLIPARTVTGDVEWPRDLDGLPIDQPSHDGVPARAALAVVEWNGTVMKVLTDCREQFPPLTHLCAKDVCVEADPCDRGWTNVQEALDDLCEERDLEHHNQHLHGWGVVCGLQVQCPDLSFEPEPGGDPRELVFLRNGYAIHPSGADIRVDAELGYTPVDLAQLAIDDGVVERNPDGNIPDVSVSLWIDKGGGPVLDRLHVEPYDPGHKRTWTELLEGTILVDIYNDCVVKVVELLQDQLASDPATPVDLRAKRVIALLNLFWQLINQTSGKHIYLSGDAATPDDLEKEDGLLRDFFDGLKGLLQSKSFCAMFDDIVFPAYQVYRADLPATAPRPTTIFGTGHHSRIRIHPRRSFGVTCGNGASINVYDLAGGKFLASTPFPSSSAQVQDVAFAASGSEIYAIAWIGDAQVDSVFATGNLRDDGTITWSGDQVQCSLKLITLAVDGRSPGKVFATARGKGLYGFDLTRPSELPAAVASFLASGHLVASERDGGTMLYAGAHANATHPVAFDHVLGVPVGNPTVRLRFALPSVGGAAGSGHDDLALVLGRGVDELCAIVDGTGQTKRLVVWDPHDAAATGAGAPPIRVVELGPSWGCRIAFSQRGNWSMITYEDSYLGRAYRPGQAAPEPGIHPLQIGPVSVATDADSRFFYVLNWMSNTITVVPAVDSHPQQPWLSALDVTALQDYRGKAIVAFLKAVGRFTQFMKDCVCEHLLVNCPQPGNQKVYLADISFKNGKIYQICNFHHRRYVHTFPTVEYWMSFVPVIPMLKLAVEKLCCSVVSGLFDQLAPPQDAAAAKGDRANVAMARHGLTHAREANLASLFRGTRTQASVAGMFGKAVVERTLWQPAPGVPAAQMTSLDVVNQREEAARTKAEAMGVTVTSVRTVDSDVAPTFKALLLPPRIRAGDQVELLVDKRGKVVGFEKRTTSGGQRTAADVARTDAEAAELKHELRQMKTSHDAQAATITEMRKQLADLEAVMRELKR
jgi:hypothetical protein